MEAGRTFVGAIGLDKGVGTMPSSGEDGQVAHVFPVCDTLCLCQVLSASSLGVPEPSANEPHFSHLNV